MNIMSKLNIEIKGQVFTPEDIVLKMCSLIKNSGKVLEPSAGNGAFTQHLKNYIAIEKDKSLITDKKTLNIDFFDYDVKNKFSTIIGNPPYVKHNNIEKDTHTKLDYALFDKRTNLYLFFIEKCLRHLKDNGEMILIVPREFINLTSARKINDLLFKKGAITDYIDLGDKKIFDNACPNVAIFRFEKDNFDRTTNKDETFNCINGKITFTKGWDKIPLSKLFDVKVGAVSGADNIFTDDNGNAAFVCSYTLKTGKLKKMFFNVKNSKLEKQKRFLLNRKIKRFNDKNWYEWGRNHHVSDKPRIYVNCKTRNPKPFFINKSKYYDGSVLALFPKRDMRVDDFVNTLNNMDWKKQGFVCDGRYIFSQRSLSNALISNTLR